MKTLTINNGAGYGADFYASKKQTTQKQQNVQVNNMHPVSNVLCDKNYGVLQTMGLNVSFKGGVSKTPGNKISTNINNLFHILKTNDLIVAAPDYKKAVSSLKENVDNIKTVIKRVFYVEEKSLDRVIGFRKNLDEREAINLSESPLIIKDSKNQTGFLKKGESGYLIDGDTVNAGKYEIYIQDREETILPIKDSFTYFVDFDKEVEPKIKEINEKLISKMSPEEEQQKEVKRKIMFSDVGGMDSTIKELKKNILYPIKYPELKNGKSMRKSILLYGPPGTGKSLVAEACANESGAWYKKIKASQLDSKWVGESEENWIKLFDEARQNQPSVIFIDEIDAIAKQRDGQDKFSDKTLNTILALMSDSEKNGDSIYMIAATNKPNLLDDAICRAGRFGYKIEAPAPDMKGTDDILNIHLKDEKLDDNFDKGLVVLNLHKQSATGADIAASVEDARNAALEREHIYEKIEEGLYKPSDAKNITLKNEDFDVAIEIMKNNQKSRERKPIGFLSELYK